jgi:hypothetical protein
VADLVAAGLVERRRAVEAQTVVARTLGTASGPDTQPRPVGTKSMLVEMAGYVGGALVLASVGLFLAQYWSELAETVQVAVLAATTVLLAAAGTAVTRLRGGYAEMRAGRDEVRRRLAATLLNAAALAAAVTASRLLSILLDDTSSWPALVGGVTMLVLCAAAYRSVPSALGLVATAAAGVYAVLTVWSVAGEGQGWLVPALLLVAFAAAWLVTTEKRWFREPVLARSLGVGIAVVGAQLPLLGDGDNAVAYALTLGVAVVGFALYVRTVSWPYLAAGVLGVTLVVSEAVIDWTDGSLGVAGGVLVAGLTLLAASLAGLRVRKEATDDDSPAGRSGDRPVTQSPVTRR